MTSHLCRGLAMVWHGRIALLAATIIVAISAAYAFDLRRFLGVSEPALTSVTANAEAVEVVEVSPARGAILLSPALLMAADGEGRRCVTGVLRPASGTTMLVSRQNDGDLDVRLTSAGGSPAAAFEAASGKPVELGTTVRVRFVAKAADERSTRAERAERRCVDDRRVLRLPIYGPTTLGSEYTPQVSADDVLLVRSGRIDTFATASRTFLSALLSPGGSNGRELFPTGSTVLPAGVRIRECAPPDRRVPWSGYVEAVLGGSDDERALNVQAFTNARRVAVTAPGGSRSGGVDCTGAASSKADLEDVIGVSLLSRLVGDPNIAAEGLLVAFVVLVLQVLMSVVELWRSTPPRPEGPP